MIGISTIKKQKKKSKSSKENKYPVALTYNAGIVNPANNMPYDVEGADLEMARYWLASGDHIPVMIVTSEKEDDPGVTEMFTPNKQFIQKESQDLNKEPEVAKIAKKRKTGSQFTKQDFERYYGSDAIITSILRELWTEINKQRKKKETLLDDIENIIGLLKLGKIDQLFSLHGKESKIEKKENGETLTFIKSFLGVDEIKELTEKNNFYKLFKSKEELSPDEKEYVGRPPKIRKIEGKDQIKLKNLKNEKIKAESEKKKLKHRRDKFPTQKKLNNEIIRVERSKFTKNRSKTREKSNNRSAKIKEELRLLNILRREKFLNKLIETEENLEKFREKKKQLKTDILKKIIEDIELNGTTASMGKHLTLLKAIADDRSAILGMNTDTLTT